MGAVRWTGKAFKIVGDLLTADEVEQWIENEGRRFLEARLKKMALSAIFGKTRGKKAIRGDVRKELGDQGGDAFRTALQNSLEQFPSVLVGCAKQIADQRIESLYTQKTLDRVYAIPRDMALSSYQRLIVGVFKDSAALRNFPGLIETTLANTAANAERVFFKTAGRKPGFVLAPDYEILGCDDGFRWHSSTVLGHYYVGFDHIGAPSKTFKDEIADEYHKLVDRIGRLSRDQHGTIVTALEYDNSGV